jgi:hypothetical protein
VDAERLGHGVGVAFAAERRVGRRDEGRGHRPDALAVFIYYSVVFNGPAASRADQLVVTRRVAGRQGNGVDDARPTAEAFAAAAMQVGAFGRFGRLGGYHTFTLPHLGAAVKVYTAHRRAYELRRVRPGDCTSPTAFQRCPPPVPGSGALIEEMMARARQRKQADEPTPTPASAPEPEPEHLFDDLDDVPTAGTDPAELVLVPVEPEAGLFDNIPQAAPAPALLTELDEDDRKEFATLLNAAMPLSERARLLVKLAHQTDTKRAPVALRAIQEINTLTGVSAERPAETMPMFVVQGDVSVVAQKVTK